MINTTPSDIGIGINTYHPFASLPRITAFFHSIAQKGYYSCGRYRKNEKHCIFHYTLQGSGETWLNNQVYQTSPGIGFLNIIDDENSGYQYPMNQDTQWEFIVFCFEFGNTRDIVLELIESYGPLYNIQIEQMQQLLNRLSLSADNILSKSDSYAMFAVLISMLVQSGESFTSSIIPVMIQQVKDFVEKNITRNINVNRIAQELNFSREHISRSFIRFTGKTLQSYIAQQRLNYICRLLKSTNLTVTEIAVTMNFNSASNLALFFKKQTGLTPLQYKKHGNYPM